MATHRIIVPVVLALGVCACDPTEPSEQGQWALRVDLRDHFAGYGQPAQVLMGSQFDVEFVRHRGAEGEVEVTPEFLACIAPTASGSVIAAGEEFVVYDVGAGSVEIPAPIDTCPDLTGDAAAVTADRWSLVGVDGGFLRWSLWFEQAMAGFSAGPDGQFPAEIGQPLGIDGSPEPVRVAVGGTFQLDPVLVDDQNTPTPTEIRWSARQAELDATSDHDFLLQREDENDSNPTRLFGRVDQPDTITTVFSIGLVENAQNVGAIAWDGVPQVQAVPVEDITELELVTVYGPGDAERDWSEPVGVIAVAHDAQGNRIIAPPVEWVQTEGRLAVYQPTASEVSDVIRVDDVCRERPDEPETRTATIEARLGDLIATSELEWVALPAGPEPDPDIDQCEKQGCDCSAEASPSGSIAALLGLFGLMWIRRRSR